MVDARVPGTWTSRPKAQLCLVGAQNKEEAKGLAQGPGGQWGLQPWPQGGRYCEV